jgi:hypothetical protein
VRGRASVRVLLTTRRCSNTGQTTIPGSHGTGAGPGTRWLDPEDESWCRGGIGHESTLAWGSAARRRQTLIVWRRPPGKWGPDEAAWKKRGGRGPRNHGAEVGRELESGYFTLMVILAFWRNPATYSP